MLVNIPQVARILGQIHQAGERAFLVLEAADVSREAQAIFEDLARPFVLCASSGQTAAEPKRFESRGDLPGAFEEQQTAFDVV
jgi:hypothetical protein